MGITCEKRSRNDMCFGCRKGSKCWVGELFHHHIKACALDPAVDFEEFFLQLFFRGKLIVPLVRFGPDLYISSAFPSFLSYFTLL